MSSQALTFVVARSIVLTINPISALAVDLRFARAASCHLLLVSLAFDLCHLHACTCFRQVCADLCVPVQRLRKLQSRTLIQPGRLRHSPSYSPTSDTKLKCSLLLQVHTKRFDTRPCSPTRAVDPLPPRLKKSRVRLLFPNPRQLAELSSLRRMQLCVLLC